MKITLKKNILPFSGGDVSSSFEAIQKVQFKTGIYRGQRIGDNTIDFGFEAIIRPEHMGQLSRIEENLKPCFDADYELSIHAPLDFQEPKKMDLVNGLGAETAIKLIEFADRNRIPLIVAHPGMLRTPEAFSDYTRQKQQQDLGRLAEVAKILNSYSSSVCFSIENKPNPATDEKNETVITSPIATTYEHLAYLCSQGIPLTFDTAHYAISRATINSIVRNAQEIGSLEKALEGFKGFFSEDCKVQPEIAKVLFGLGDSIKQIHLNDCVPYQNFGKVTTQWEGLVPGEGNSVTNSDVTGFLKRRRTDLPIVIELMEKDYQKCPNTIKSMCDFLKEIQL